MLEELKTQRESSKGFYFLSFLQLELRKEGLVLVFLYSSLPCPSSAFPC